MGEVRIYCKVDTGPALDAVNIGVLMTNNEPVGIFQIRSNPYCNWDLYRSPPSTHPCNLENSSLDLAGIQACTETIVDDFIAGNPQGSFYEAWRRIQDHPSSLLSKAIPLTGYVPPRDFPDNWYPFEKPSLLDGHYREIDRNIFIEGGKRFLKLTADFLAAL